MSCEKYILAAVFLFLWQPLAGAASRGVSSVGKDYYVSVSGNDLGNGSRKNPWKTISHAARHVRPGGTVHVASGTYYGDVVTTATGTRNARVRFVSDQQWA